MAAATLVTEAILLARKDSGEKGRLLTLLSPTQGLLRAFMRTSTSRGSRQPHPDLFDEGTLTMEQAPGGELWFVRDYVVQIRRTGIGGAYESLLYASRFAVLLSHHLFPAEEAAGWFSLLRQSLEGFESRHHPAAAYLKSLYLFAREQGIPLQEEWLPSLPQSRRGTFAAILRTPLADQTTPAAETERLIALLERYLVQQDVQIPT